MFHLPTYLPTYHSINASNYVNDSFFLTFCLPGCLYLLSLVALSLRQHLAFSQLARSEDRMMTRALAGPYPLPRLPGHQHSAAARSTPFRGTLAHPTSVRRLALHFTAAGRVLMAPKSVLSPCPPIFAADSALRFGPWPAQRGPAGRRSGRAVREADRA